MLLWTLLTWALGVGLLQGFLHCAGMCGPFVMAYSLSVGYDKSNPTSSFLSHVWRGHAPYNIGRVITFSLLGAVFGLFGSFVDSAAHVRGFQAAAGFLGGGLMLWWAIDEFRTRHAGAFLEQFSIIRLPVIQRWFKRLSGHKRPVASLLSGSILGMHPCGLLFAMLFSAAASGSALRGGLIMLAFGVGTMPSLLAVAIMGWYGRRRLRGLAFTYVTASLIGLSGVLFILRGLASNGLVPKVNMWLF
ncbi:sulfite exporter TauE/SafE family protein [Alicyclobacillus ferrooxydans]|uniref:sulfite exporter TauE/SafE family protein n=1 Tax=Alicyclobacillus ferrooxydans TaxID=471514 RepID=UPI000A6E6389|nr:sulfite exporter TauE/SafE family protein [Alicyclobacillus ferrooxydans]